MSNNDTLQSLYDDSKALHTMFSRMDAENTSKETLTWTTLANLTDDFMFRVQKLNNQTTTVKS